MFIQRPKTDFLRTKALNQAFNNLWLDIGSMIEQDVTSYGVTTKVIYI